MMIGGVWHENITCPTCRQRHPGFLSCQDAKAIAEEARTEWSTTEADYKSWMEEERAAFEAYILQTWDEPGLPRDGDGYENVSPHFQWLGWIARARKEYHHG